jgi:hypothetical protein
LISFLLIAIILLFILTYLCGKTRIQTRIPFKDFPFDFAVIDSVTCHFAFVFDATKVSRINEKNKFILK